MASDLRVISAEIKIMDYPVQRFNRELNGYVEVTNTSYLKVKFSDHTHEMYDTFTNSKIDRSMLELLQKKLRIWEDLIVRKTMLIEKYKKHNPTLPERKRLSPFFMNEIQYDIYIYEYCILKLKAVLNYIEEEITRDRKSFMEVIKTPCKPGSTLKGLPIVMMREIMSYL
jgi:hypothetical protein